MPDASFDSGTLARANGIELFHQCFGDRNRPALLLVMGLGTQMIAWDEAFCRRLADRGYFVIRFDNRDIGKSTWLDHEDVPSAMALLMKAKMGMKLKVPYRLDDMAADAIGLLDALGIERAHVVGASMGGMIGQRMAIAYPSRVLTLTSIMSSTGSPDLPGPTSDAMAVMLAPPSKTVDEYIVAHRKVMKVLRAGEFPEDEAGDADRAALAWSRGYHPAGSGRQLAAIIADGDRTESLKTVTLPTLVVHGKRDPLAPVEGGIATAAAIPNAKLHLIDDLGHALPRRHWDELIGAIAAHAR